MNIRGSGDGSCNLYSGYQSDSETARRTGSSCIGSDPETDRIMGQTYIKTIIFDFEETTFMDSSGIGLIMGRYRALGMGKGCIKAVNVSSYVEKLLHLSGVHKFIC